MSPVLGDEALLDRATLSAKGSAGIKGPTCPALSTRATWPDSRRPDRDTKRSFSFVGGRKATPSGNESSDARSEGVKFGSSDTTVRVRSCAGIRQPQKDPSKENWPAVTPGTPASCVANAEKSPVRSAAVGTYEK